MNKTLISFIFAFFLSSCSLFFHPDKKLYSDPAEKGIVHEVIKFKPQDGRILTGLFFPASGEAKATIVHFHGNSQNISAHWHYSAKFAQYGYNVFIFDYGGFGASEGRPSIEQAIKDGAAAIRHSFLLPGAKPDKIVLFAQSLGSAIAPASAAQVEGFKPAALIIEGGFYSYKDVAIAVAKENIYLWPLIWYPEIFVRDKYAPFKYIDKIPCPKLFIHSRKDKTVPFSQGLKYYQIAPAPKEFIETPDNHIEALGIYSDLFLPKILMFLDKALEQ